MEQYIPVKTMTQEMVNDLFQDKECIFLRGFGDKNHNYTITDHVIGKGGGQKSTVYETCEEKNCQYVAKVEKTDESKKRENELLCQIKASIHNLAPKIYEIWMCQDKTVFIMDRLVGMSLGDYFSPKHKVNEDMKKEILRKAHEALEKLHSIGIIHGDPHLENFIVVNDKINLIDFGDAKDFGDRDMRNTMIANTDTLTLDTDIRETYPTILARNSPKILPVEDTERRQFRSLSPNTIDKVEVKVEEDEKKVDTTNVEIPIWAQAYYKIEREIDDNDPKLIKILKKLEQEILVKDDLFEILERIPYKTLTNDYKNKIYSSVNV